MFVRVNRHYTSAAVNPVGRCSGVMPGGYIMKKEMNKRILKRYWQICMDRRRRYRDRDSIHQMRMHAYWHGKANVVEMLLDRAIRESK